MRPTSWFEISLSTSCPKKSNLSRWSRLIRTKLYPLGTVRAPLDAYGSKIKLLKKNQCVDSTPISFFVTDFRFSKKGFFLHFSKNMGFGPSLKKEFTDWINLSLIYCFVEMKITMSFSCSWMGSFNSFRFMFYSGERSVQIPFAHIGQMISVPLLFATTFFNLFHTFPKTKLFDVFIILASTAVSDCPSL